MKKRILEQLTELPGAQNGLPTIEHVTVVGGLPDDDQELGSSEQYLVFCMLSILNGLGFGVSKNPVLDVPNLIQPYCRDFLAEKTQTDLVILGRIQYGRAVSCEPPEKWAERIMGSGAIVAASHGDEEHSSLPISEVFKSTDSERKQSPFPLAVQGKNIPYEYCTQIAVASKLTDKLIRDFDLAGLGEKLRLSRKPILEYCDSLHP